MRTRVKICGLTRSEDAQAAVDAGADALGLVFFQESRRNVTLDQAKAMMNLSCPFVTWVGLFVNADPGFVHKILCSVPLGLLQFHGHETAAYCDSFGLPYIKSVPVQSCTDVYKAIENYPHAQGLLLDRWDPVAYGGTGRIFDWSQIPADIRVPWILAGGLRPDNVGEAVQSLHPYAVDVSGGVETAPGIKDTALMQAFVRGVHGLS